MCVCAFGSLTYFCDPIINISITNSDDEAIHHTSTFSLFSTKSFSKDIDDRLKDFHRISPKLFNKLSNVIFMKTRESVVGFLIMF